MKDIQIINVIFLFLIFTIVSCGNGKKTNNLSQVDQSEQVESARAVKMANSVSNQEASLTSEVGPGELKKAKELIASVPRSAIDAVDAKKNYKMFCTSCHGFKGNAKINRAADLTKSNSKLARRVAKIYFGKGVMTPFAGVMTDAEIIAVAEYIITLRK